MGDKTTFWSLRCAAVAAGILLLVLVLASPGHAQQPGQPVVATHMCTEAQAYQDVLDAASAGDNEKVGAVWDAYVSSSICVAMPGPYPLTLVGPASPPTRILHLGWRQVWHATDHGGADVFVVVGISAPEGRDV